MKPIRALPLAVGGLLLAGVLVITALLYLTSPAMNSGNSLGGSTGAASPIAAAEKDFSAYAPKIGDIARGGTITSVTDTGNGCYSYSVNHSAMVTAFCIDLTAEAYNALPDKAPGK